jgi:voltage-gated potassium channel Kch
VDHGPLDNGGRYLFYAAVSSVELAVEGAVRGYFERRRVRAKIEIVGADRTLSPYAVGGRRLASLATQPLIVDFLDIVTRGRKA